MGRREKAVLGGLLVGVGGALSNRARDRTEDERTRRENRIEDERKRREELLARLKEERQFRHQKGLLASTQVDEFGNVIGIPRGAKGPGDVIDLGFKTAPKTTSGKGELSDAQLIADAKSRYTTEDTFAGKVTDWPGVDAYLAAKGRPDLAAPRKLPADTTIDKDSDEWRSAAEDAKKTAKEMERPLSFDTTIFEPFGGETKFIRDKTMEYYLVNKGVTGTKLPSAETKRPAPGTSGNIPITRTGKKPTGTQNDPHQPTTRLEFDKIKSGEYFIDPGDSTLRKKN